MSALREAAQQALEAMEVATTPLAKDRQEVLRAQAALRAALAQEQAELKPLPCPTPKTCREHCCGGWCGPRAGLAQERAEPKPMHPELRKMWEELAAMPQQTEPLNLSDRAVQRRLAAQWGYVPAALAEPTQEPVAWLQPKTVDAHSRPDLGYETCSKDDYGAFPVHTAPPRRTMVPLTEGEIDAEWHELDGEASPLFKRVILKFARAIEKASWEKNK